MAESLVNLDDLSKEELVAEVGSLCKERERLDLQVKAMGYELERWHRKAVALRYALAEISSVGWVEMVKDPEQALDYATQFLKEMVKSADRGGKQ